MDWAWQLAKQSLNYGEQFRWWHESKLSTLLVNNYFNYLYNEEWFFSRMSQSWQFMRNLLSITVLQCNCVCVCVFLITWRDQWQPSWAVCSSSQVQERVDNDAWVTQSTVSQLLCSVVEIFARPQWMKFVAWLCEKTILFQNAEITRCSAAVFGSVCTELLNWSCRCTSPWQHNI